MSSARQIGASSNGSWSMTPTSRRSSQSCRRPSMTRLRRWRGFFVDSARCFAGSTAITCNGSKHPNMKPLRFTLPDGEWRVALFVQRLEAALATRLGGVERIEIFFDRRNLGGNQPLAELLKVVGKSALFLAVGSPGYATRAWTQDELSTFVKTVGDMKRLFAIECLPL